MENIRLELPPHVAQELADLLDRHRATFRSQIEIYTVEYVLAELATQDCMPTE